MKDTKKTYSMRKIAKELGISTTTVSRVLNNRHDVDAETRKRVLEFVRKNSYQYRGSILELKLIGVVDTYRRHSISSYYISGILEGIDDRISRRGYTIILLHADEIDRDYADFGFIRCFNHISGLIWMEPVFSSFYEKIVTDQKIPCVVINNYDDNVKVDIVESDNYSAAKIAVEYLVGQGHRHIAFIGGWMNLTNHKERLRGFKDALNQSGLEPRNEHIITDIIFWNEEGGAEGVYRIFSTGSKPTAIVVCSDFLITGVYAALKDLGYSIPKDVSVISFDDSPIARYLNPPLTSCKQPLKEIGSIAAEHLLTSIDGLARNYTREKVRMPFIVRESTTVPRS